MKVTKIMLGVLIFGSISSIPLKSIANSIQQNQQIIEILEQEKQVTEVYRVYYGSESMATRLAISFHNQLMESHHDRGYLIIELSEEDRKKLKSLNLSLKPAKDYIQQRNQRLSQRQSQIFSLNNEVEPTAIPGYSCYETVEETFGEAQNLVTSYSNLAEWIDVGDSWEKTTNQGGYDIRVLVLTNKSNTFDKPKLFINSAIHAREYTTAPLNLAFAKWLVEGYASNADARWILDYHEVHLMLQTNPDGRKMAEAGSSWRKNTNQNYCGSTSSSRGADLNRNFTDRWNITNGSGSSGSQCNATYRGPSAGSEPEIQAIESYVRSLWPDLRGPNDSDAAPLSTTGMHIDLHSYSELVLWPWGDQNSPAPNGNALQALGRKFAYFNGYMPQQSIGLYATDGTSDNVSYSELGVPAFTFELGTSFFQNCSTFTNTIKPDNLPALVYAAKVAGAPYVTPSGPDTLNVNLSDDASGAGVPAGTSVTLSASATDTRFSSRNGTEATQNISGAEYTIDTPPWQSGAVAYSLNASDGSYNNKTESVTGAINTSNLSVGEHIVYVRSKDTSNIFGAVSAVFLKITDGTPPPLNADFTFNCQQLTCSFDASASTGAIDSYQWNFGDSNVGSGSPVSHTFATAGDYSVQLTVTDSDNNSDTTSSQVSVSDSGDGALENGIPVTDLSAQQGEEVHFIMQVPENAKNLKFVISGGSGDADLYVRFAAEPTTSQYDCRPYRNGNNEECSISNVQQGTYYVMLRAYSSYSGVSLTGSYTVGGTGGSFAQNDLAATQGEWKHFSVELAAGMSTFDIDMSGGSGDADLYVRQGSEPSTSQYDCRPYRWGNTENCSISNPQAGTWYISVRAYSTYSNVDINAVWE
ncbi:M14 family zinc carboxypeptidase [Aliikangiella sp. G2MR2-5]|uniref:M14 family zinc carboxypeptidase n=1 Tax=Aliikangiella sp. G2MR2-5 TaxID=2788943 RepID=UPI0018AA6C79|nr:M14 family zinc carboxypeptidase [Aliikangiella sp. G2MR2-5]